MVTYAELVSQARSRLTALGFEAVSAGADQAVRAAVIQHTLKLSYADAFVVALAEASSPCVLVTADFDFKHAEHLVPIEFLTPNRDLP